MLSLAIGRNRFFQPCCVILGFEERVIWGRLTLFSIGAPAMVVPEQKCPNSSTFLLSSEIFCAVVPACLGSHWSSSGLTTIFLPSRPPLAFHSSAAMLIPFR